MKAKTIRKVLKDKITEWANSIEDETLRELVKKNTIVTGGCIASMLLGEKVNDFDVYFRNKDVTMAVARYYASRFVQRDARGIAMPIKVVDRVEVKRGVWDQNRVQIVVQSAGIASEEGSERPYEYFEGRPDIEADEYVGDIMTGAGDIEEESEQIEAGALENDEADYRPVFLSSNAITLSRRVQIVIRFFGEPDEIHENYDFVHCTNYWKSWDDELVLRPAALESLLSRELRYVGSKYPLCSIIRIRKFIQRQWTINAGQILKMVMQLQELDLKDHCVLRDQLTGVDAAYFVQLVQKLQEKDPEKVNSAYLIEIVDRMF